MPFRFSNRRSRPRLLLEFSPHLVLAAEISQPQRGKVLVESLAEFSRDNTPALDEWLEARAWNHAICGVVPSRGIVQREILEPQRLGEPDYLAAAVEEQQKGQFLTATPFKVVDPQAWTLRAIDAAAGERLPDHGAPQPALICGVINQELRAIQERLQDAHVIPDRIEAGLLSLFGAVARYNERRGDTRAVGILVIHAVASAVYILGKEGVHTPTPILHGLGSVVELARKELGVKEEAEVRRLLYAGDPLAKERAERLVRRIGRDLKPVLDSYEMTTGQPLDEVLCVYLPPALEWLGPAVATVAGRLPMAINCVDWMPSVGLQLATDTPAAPHWLGALSLIAQLPHTARLPSGRATTTEIYHRAWHVDYTLPAFSAGRLAASRRFVTRAFAAAVLVFTALLAAWQIYANASLRKDLNYWEGKLTVNRRLFDELSVANTRLQSGSGALKQAYDLMAPPYQLSQFIIALGRTIPPHMRIDRIETNDGGVAISGLLLEPAERATDTIEVYKEELRRNPAIGPLFSSIAITSLQRKGEGDNVLFQITLRLKEPPS